jgi:hypothetical protein
MFTVFLRNALPPSSGKKIKPRVGKGTNAGRQPAEMRALNAAIRTRRTVKESVTLKRVSSSETSVNLATRRHITEDSNLYV